MVEVLHRLPEDGLVRGVILRPAVEVGEAAPPAQAEALVDGITPGRRSPACSGSRNSRSFGPRPAGNPCRPAVPVRPRRGTCGVFAVGVAPVLAGTDQAEVVLAPDH